MSNAKIVEEVKELEEVKNMDVKVKENNKEKVKENVVEVKKTDNNDDIFITEKDRFTISIKYYLDGKEPIIEGFSEGYSYKSQEVHSFDVYFKYPSQKDVEYIMSVKPMQNIENAEIVDFVELENVRLITLLRGWSMDRPLEDLAQIHPTIVKALRVKISETIAGNGLF